MKKIKIRDQRTNNSQPTTSLKKSSRYCSCYYYVIILFTRPDIMEYVYNIFIAPKMNTGFFFFKKTSVFFYVRKEPNMSELSKHELNRAFATYHVPMHGIILMNLHTSILIVLLMMVLCLRRSYC